MVGHSLNKILESSVSIKQVFKSSLEFGDIIFLYTRNSLYSISVVDKKTVLVSGGWFDKEGLSPYRTSITGCTWGGKIIKIDIIAACGLCLEFGNRVVTSPIQKIVILKSHSNN
jgi:hypothetical protein